ncbi:MAG: VCBS repeat-containing protein [Sandaracinaceae bacterium]|nr:VCBS repeat-containing protein [Sandaracinaceae bacterium]
MLILLLTLAGCGSSGGGLFGEPSLDELNAVRAVPDENADDTPPDASFEPGQRRDVGGAQAVFPSQRPNEYVSGVVMPGDLDGDGYGDLVMWAHLMNDPDVVDCSRGCPGFGQLVVYVAYGGSSFGADGVIRADARLESWHINGIEPWVSSAGDVDGDGRPDVLISVGADCQQGNVLTLYGGSRLSGTMDVRDLPGGVLRETGACTRFGNAVGVGDLDGDGFADFVVAAPSSDRSYLYYGRAGRSDARRSELDADAILLATGIDGVGPAQPAGDVNGDGLDDMIVAGSTGPAFHEDVGVWHLVLGGPRLAGEVPIETLGTAIEAAFVSGLGDLDGDGRGELGVTRNGAGVDGFVLPGRGEWPAALGVEDGALRIARALAPGAVGGSTALRPAGDVNGDGALDFLYSDSEATSDGYPRGSVQLFLGPRTMDATLEASSGTEFLGQLWLSEHDGSVRGFDSLGEWSWRLGNGLAAGSDLDGDGYGEIAIVARIAPDSGRLYLWRGRP